ncbi:MAG TPA: hypothetical protein VJS68_01625, partial [Thermoplasmata archaeon]|nr:hypothetical protein [Thermoplasmata archaeon]
MRIVLAQLAPRRGDPAANLARLDGLVTPGTADLWVFPELYLSGYKVGDALHSLALSEGDATVARLTLIAHSRAT